MDGEYTINMPEYPDDFRIDINDNRIHKTAIIGQNVIMGRGNTIAQYVSIEGNTIIGDNNHFYPFCSIGSDPEHRTFYKAENKGVSIANSNVIREGVTINGGCYRETTICSRNWLLRGAYIAHDTIVKNDCTISANVLLGGHCYVMENANLGMGAIVHQYSVIGAGVMLGMGSIVTKKTKIEPMGVYMGNPARYVRENTYVTGKWSVSEKDQVLREYLKLLVTNAPT